MLSFSLGHRYNKFRLYSCSNYFFDSLSKRGGRWRDADTCTQGRGQIGSCPPWVDSWEGGGNRQCGAGWGLIWPPLIVWIRKARYAGGHSPTRGWICFWQEQFLQPWLGNTKKWLPLNSSEKVRSLLSWLYGWVTIHIDYRFWWKTNHRLGNSQGVFNNVSL